MNRQKLSGLTVITAALSLFFAAAQAQDLRASLFQQTDKLMGEARSADAVLLSPSSFADAEKSYAKAETMLSKDKSIESIRKELTKVNTSLRTAIENADLARVNFASEIKARNAAVQAQADSFAADEWSDAEESFADAAERLEDGNVNRAKKGGMEAGKLYREAELVAIQAAILGEARSLIAAAKDDRIDRDAPVTMARAISLVAQAEQDLVKNRYAVEGVLKMAVEAEYDAKHAVYLASQVRRLKDKDVTPENLLLEWERPMVKLATALDTSTDFSKGFAVPVDASLARIADSKANAAAANENVTTLSARVEKLEEQLGITTRRAAAGELRRQQVTKLDDLFRSDEARIVQEGDNVTVRLIGLQFATGQAVIESQYFSLLRKLDQVPQIFPGAKLIVEGHTDAQGNDAMNLALSERRANSVRDYLLASTMLNASEVKSQGIGEAKPIANNETAAGRAQNRRTDIVIDLAK
jgi:outer membrane protein OmpA-like peptidoglycan-associated protein